MHRQRFDSLVLRCFGRNCLAEVLVSIQITIKGDTDNIKKITILLTDSIDNNQICFRCAELDKISAYHFQIRLEVKQKGNVSSAARIVKLEQFNSFGKLYLRVEGTVICLNRYSCEEKSLRIT